MLGNYYTEGAVPAAPSVGAPVSPIRSGGCPRCEASTWGPARDSLLSMIAFTAFGRVLLFDSLYGLCAAPRS